MTLTINNYYDTYGHGLDIPLKFRGTIGKNSYLSALKLLVLL